MAYGLIEDKTNDSAREILLYRDGSLYRTYGPASGTIKESYKYRSGSNATIGLRSAEKLVAGFRWKRVTYRDKSLPRVPVQFYNSRTGAYYFRRVHPLVSKLVKKTIRKKGRAKRGLDLPPNPLEYFEVKLSKAPKELTVTTDTGKYRYEGFMGYQHPAISTSSLIGQNVAAHCAPGVSPVSLAKATELDAPALSRLYENAKDQRVNIAQVFAERAQTVRLLADSAVRLAGVIGKIKRGDLSGAVKTALPKNAKELSSDWLAYQYGVKPLLSDIEGLISELNRGGVFRTDVIGSRHEKVSSNGAGYTGDNGTYTIGPYCSWSTKLEAEVTVKYKLKSEVNSNGLKLMSSIGIANPAALAWELVPWSFVIDWFIPIGDYLNTIDSLVGYKPLHIHKTVFVKETIRGKKSYTGYDSNFRLNWTSDESEYEVKRVWCKRSILTQMPEVAAPRLSNPLSTTHLANAIALLVLNIKR